MTQWIVDLLDRHPAIRQAPGYYVDWVRGVLVFGDYRVVPRATITSCIRSGPLRTL